MSRLMLLAAPFAVMTISVPLIMTATFTTIVAINVLFFRYTMVCFDFIGAFVRAFLWESTLPAPKPPNRQKSPLSPTAHIPLRPEGVLTPITAKLTSNTRSFASFAGYSDTSRDFEGVGGWRLSSNNDDDATWIGHNSRLELPTVTGGDRHRRHRRTSSSQSVTFRRDSDTGVTPLTRTPAPIDTDLPIDGYFGLKPHEYVPMSPEEHTAKSRMDERNRLIRSSSQSSGFSGQAFQSG